MSHLIRAFLDELRRTQFMPPQLMVQYQRQLLEPLVRHARQHVPFYRDTGRLDRLFRRDGSIDWERWGEIPWLTRRDVQQNFEALKAEFLPPEHGRSWLLHTAGSTAEPIQVVHTSLGGYTVWIAQFLRDLERHRVDPTRRLAFLGPSRGVTPPSLELKPHNAWYPGFDELGLLGERHNLVDTRPASELVESIVRLRPDYLWAQPITLQIMCANDRLQRLGELGIDVVMTVGDRFPFDAKREVALHIGCRVMDQYVSQECGRIATNCPECGRFHIEAEANLVEVVDDAGATAQPGEIGWVLVTPFYNYAMPLIRYDHADQARPGDLDQCGITLPPLEEVVGKERTRFVFPNGVVMRPTLSSKVVIEFLGAQAYQVAQVASDRCEVRIVPGDRPPSEMQFDAVTQLLRATWWDKLKVDYRIVNALPRHSPRGKIPLTVYEVPEPAGDT